MQLNSAISTTQLALAITLLFAMALISVFFRAKLEKSIFIASIRMILQLLAVGILLEYVFKSTHLWTLFAVGAVMIGVAIHANGQRISSRPYFFWMGTSISIVTCVVISMAFAASVLTTSVPWTSPRFFIPFLGLIIGNTLTGVSLGLDSIISSLERNKNEIECFIALGATPIESGLHFLQEALKRSLTPILNGMTITGLVALPGVMTGQILTGESPNDAAHFQIAIMCLLGFSTALGSALSVFIVYFKQFNSLYQWNLKC